MPFKASSKNDDKSQNGSDDRKDDIAPTQFIILINKESLFLCQ